MSLIRRFSRDAAVVFVVSLAARVVAVAVTATTDLNPYSGGDTEAFARAAAAGAQSLLAGRVPPFRILDVHEVWGALLAPLWLLPGPNRLYGQIWIAFLGAAAVRNVYIVGRRLHSPSAGALAAAPIAAFPSLLFVHSTILREAFVLYCLTALARIHFAPEDWLGRWSRYGVSAVVLVLLFLPRWENAPVYALVIAVAIVTSRRVRGANSRLVAGGIGGVGLAVAVAGFRWGRSRLDWLATIRRRRAHGRTAYLEGIYPDTVPKAIAFSGIGAAYFLFSPFPWMVSTASDFVVMVEGTITLGYTVASVRGARVAAEESFSGVAALVVGLLAGAILYGLANANVGTVVRQRQMMTWVVFLLGAVGVADAVTCRRAGEGDIE